MRRSNHYILLICVFSCLGTNILLGQDLRVTLSPDRSKVDRSTKNGVATIFFDSKVKDLNIVCTDENPEEPIVKLTNNLWFIHIDAQKDIDLDSICYRNFLLTSNLSSEYYLTTDAISPNQVLYYTVVLPEQYQRNLSFEYIYSKTAIYGVRVAYGKRFGFYLSYKWGEYKKQGNDISTITQDYEISEARNLGYIRTAITGGLRLGVLHKEKINLYVLIGGGYGEYGRQWENQLEVNNSTLFYSDYIQGFEGELACQCILYDWLSISIGTNMVVGNGNISVDYQIGAGMNINLDKLIKRGKKIP
jgi:hypothetical protein